jgi:hypothetical protein
MLEVHSAWPLMGRLRPERRELKGAVFGLPYVYEAVENVTRAGLEKCRGWRKVVAGER